MLARLKLLIAKLRQVRFGASAERGTKLDKLELQLEELGAAARSNQAAVRGHPGDRLEPMPRRPARRPLPAHLPRERVVIPGPLACPCCQGRLTKLGEDVTETLEVVPRSWKVIQTVRDRLICRACETITRDPVSFHSISRGCAGPELLATILGAKFSQHLPFNRQSETFATRRSTSTSSRWRAG